MLPDRGNEGVPHILGRYSLLHRKLGSGNYATVVEAVHLDLEVHVAIKIIDTSKVRDQYVLRNLAREAALLRRLSHPNIIAVFESMRAGPLYCLVTELVGGGELSAYVSRQANGHLDENETTKFARQLLSALAHMHDRGVLHRDLKMKNILLSRNQDVVKIVDFGLSNVWSAESPLRTHCGSPGYAAPEIYDQGKTYGPEVDMWSLGVVLYGMAVGHFPFPTCRDKTVPQHERRKRMIAQISKGATESHMRAMSHFSPLFRDLVARLLTVAPNQRLTIRGAVLHPWLANRPPPNDRLYRLTARESGWIFSQIAIMLNMPVRAIEEQCRANRLGEVAAAYNILAHQQLSTYHVAWEDQSSTPDIAPSLDLQYNLAVSGEQEKERQNQTSFQSSTNDVLQTGADSYPPTARVSTLQIRRESLKKRISRRTLEPKFITAFPPSSTTKLPGSTVIEKPFKQTNFDQSSSVYSTSPCFAESSIFDDATGATSTKPKQKRKTSLKTTKSVSFPAVFIRSEDVQTTEQTPVKNGIRRPVTSIGTSTNELVHQSVQTDSIDIFVSQRANNAPCSKNVKMSVECESTTNEKIKYFPVKYNKSITSVEFLNKLILKKNDEREPAPVIVEELTEEMKACLSDTVNWGTYSSILKGQNGLALAANEHTLKQKTLGEQSCTEFPPSNARIAGLPQTPQLITGSSQSKALLKSACPSRHTTCSKEGKENSESNQTNNKNKLKKWSHNTTLYAIQPTSRYMMDVALEKSFGRTRYVTPMPWSKWAPDKKGSAPTAKSRLNKIPKKTSVIKIKKEKVKTTGTLNTESSSALPKTSSLKLDT